MPTSTRAWHPKRGSRNISKDLISAGPSLLNDSAISWRSAFCLLGAFSLGAAIQVRDGEYTPAAALLVGIAIVVTVAAFASGPRLLSGRGRAIAGTACIACLLAQFCRALSSRPSGQFPWSNDLRPLQEIPGGQLGFRIGIVCGGVLLLGAVVCEGRLRRVLLVLMLLLHLALACWLIHNSPNPHIDTFVFQKEADAALRRGDNPYAITIPDIYHSTEPGARPVYGEGMVKEGRFQSGYIYPPISLLVGFVADTAFGDPRYALAIAATLAGAVIAFTRLSRWSILAAAMLLWTPRGFFIVGRAWIDPLVLLAVVTVAWAALRAPRLTPVAFGLMLVVKQYLVLLVPAAVLLPRGRGPRSLAGFLAVAALVGAAVVLPFFLRNPAAFYNSVVHAQLAVPFREDGLTFFNTFHRITGIWPSNAVTFVPLAAAWLFVAWRGERSVAGFLAGAALILLVFFAFNKHAFANYYYLVLGILCAAAAMEGPASEPAAHEKARG